MTFHQFAYLFEMMVLRLALVVDNDGDNYNDAVNNQISTTLVVQGLSDISLDERFWPQHVSL